MRVAIYGAGAMGTVLGAYLAKAGENAYLITRNRAHVEELNKNGAKISGEVDFTVPVRAVLPQDMEGKYDIIFLAAKQTHNAEIARFLKDYIAEDGVLCTIQNGLPEYVLCDELGANKVVGCVCSWGAALVKAGEAALTSSPKKLRFQLGALADIPHSEEKVARVLSLMGAVTKEDNFIGARWSKLIINCAFSPLSGVTGLTFGQIAKDRFWRRISQYLFNEGAAVCRASGVTPAKIQGHDAVKLFSYKGAVKRALSYALYPLIMKNHAHIVSGIYYDLLSGRESEAHAMSGIVASRGKELGVPTPYTDRVLSVIDEISRGERSLGAGNSEAFSI